MTLLFNDFPQELSFKSNDNQLPPCNIEIEEAILGSILLDPEAIYRVKDRLRSEHFYINAHRDIYRACLKLSNKNQKPDLLNVTSFLTDKGILADIGGRTTLGNLVDRAVTSVNIDHLALEIIKKATKRQIIKVGHEIAQASYDRTVDLDELLSIIKTKTQAILETPIAATKEENLKFRHDRLVKELTEIYTTCDEPSLRYLKLKELADESRLSLGFLENFYLKSLTAQCGKLLSLKDLQELAGSTVREWLLNGLVPKHSTILLVSDGGVGKTKFVYGIGKTLIQGKEFGTFHPTSQKRKILYYQGDESPGDMWQALQQLGYSEEDEDKFVKIRFGWSSENMPTLIKDLNEFKPDLVVIDSLSTINRFSSYQESQLEYARPVLEMTGLAIQHKCTFLIIHHTSRKGDVRGTTAIRNAVSEVWSLTKPIDGQSTPSDRILEINKSRSRSSGKKYRLYFNEDLTFDFLGDEAEELGGPNATNKDKLLAHLSQNRNIRFTSRELGHILNINDDSARRALAQLSGDGLISCHKVKGKSNLYFLSYEGEQTEQSGSGLVVLGNPTFPNCKETLQVIRGQTHDHPVITSDDHPEAIDLSMVSAKGDQVITENDDFKNSEEEIFSEQIERSGDHLSLEALPGNVSKVIIEGDHQGDQGVITPGDDHLVGSEVIQNPEISTEVVQPAENPLEKQFPIGSWVRYNATGGLAQVVGHSMSDKLDLDGRDKSKLFGSYVADACTLIEQDERLKLGLSTKLAGRDLNRTPELIVGCHYWSQELQNRVKLTQINEDTVNDFKNPTALVMPCGSDTVSGTQVSLLEAESPKTPAYGVPTRVKLDDLVACYDSPSPELKTGDVVAVWIGNKRKEKIVQLGCVSRLDYQGVWVKFPPAKGDKWSDSKKFYAHRMEKVDD